MNNYILFFYGNGCLKELQTKNLYFYCIENLTTPSTQEDEIKSLKSIYNVVKKERLMTPPISKPAPKFTATAVVDGAFKEITLDQYKGKYVVLFFYPLDFTYVCPTEIIGFSDASAEFRKTNCELIAASCDSEFTHLAWVKTPRADGGLGELKIPLIADKSGKIAQDYGVYNQETGVPFRGLFIIDDRQILRQVTVNDLSVGRSVDETLRLVKAFQHADVYGEVCPAGWKPGGRAIKPNPQSAQEYFRDVNKN